MSGETSRSGTPPYCPIYEVSLSDETIERLARCACPESKLISVTPLAFGGSYNNRIYFLKLRPSQANAIGDAAEREVVLKVNGRFFGADKVQNEVACLRLLETYCPAIPVPRVLAWSEDGEHAVLAAQHGNAHIQKFDTSIDRPNKSPSHVGWILMSRAIGEPLSTFNLDQTTLAELARQLADLVAIWRRGIPAQRHCGNARFRSGEYGDASAEITLGDVSGTSNPELVVRGILGEGIKLPAPLGSVADYYKVKLEDKLRQLESKDIFAPNRTLLHPLRMFLSDFLPRLWLDDHDSGTDEASKFIFTHYDLSPRNVLISGQPPQITGIVDFEFAGFFSPLEEFLNDYVGNDGDWPKAVYDAYLERLEERGIATPARSISKKVWERAFRIEKLVEHIAPWWLPGQFSGAGLEEELKKSRQTAQEMLEKLEKSLPA